MIGIFPKPSFKRRTPKQGQRGVITKEQYQLALDYFGDSCTICNAHPVEMHHVVFRSQGGRGLYRNLMPLCKVHHIKAHKDRGFADSLRAERAEGFSKYYFCDRFDLSDHGLIDGPDEQAFENYMKMEEQKI